MKIEDTGIGIEYKDQQHLFDIFQQDSSDKMITTSKTMGLGLLISNMIVKKFDGSLGFISVHKTGSQFYFNFALENVIDKDASPLFKQESKGSKNESPIFKQGDDEILNDVPEQEPSFRLIQSTEEQGTLRQETVHQSERRQEDPIILQLDDDDTVVEDLEDDQLMQDKSENFRSAQK